MKRLISILTIALIASLPFSLFIGCTTSDSESLPPYYVAFTIDGERFVWEYGLTNIERNTFASKLNESSVYTHFIALPIETEWSGGLANLITISVEASAEGTYPIYHVVYTKDGTSYLLVNGSITITNYEDEDGVIEGTFIAEVSEDGTNIIIENGKFKVMRVADDTYWT
jgi:hypothetical protein